MSLVGLGRVADRRHGAALYARDVRTVEAYLALDVQG